jgi:pentatricopeptide repeat protein
VRLDFVNFVGVLNECANMIALEEGRCVHNQIIECKWNLDVFVANSLVDMYAKCGSIDDVQGMFSKMPSQDVVTWTHVIGMCAMQEGAKDIGTILTIVARGCVTLLCGS